MSASPEVSVVIATRDRWGLLEGALASVLRQEAVSFEALVVSDGSTDETAERVAGLGDPRIVLDALPAPIGVAAARNRGIERARGTWVAFLDDDDLWAPGRLRASIDAAGGASVVYGARLLVDERREALAASLAERPEEVPERIRHANVIGGPSAVMVRTEQLRRAGGFDTAFSALADWDLWLRVVEPGGVAACPDLLVAYTEWPQNMHVRDPDAVLREFAALNDKHGGDLDEAGFLGWVAQDSSIYGRRLQAARLQLRAARLTRRSGDFALAGFTALRGLGGSGRPTDRPRLAGPAWLAPYRSAP
jgi:glycosyltransferase involved in cell wall biosynthesis